LIGNVIQMSSIPAKIDISTVTPVLAAHYVKANLEIEKTPGYIDMYSKNITCNVDSSACQAEEGHKTARMLMAEYAQQGMSAAQECAHDTAVEGQMMVHAGRGEKVIQGVAKEEMMGEVPNTGIKFSPSERPTITWNKNELVMDGHPAKNVYNWTTSLWADMQLERKGSVTVTETQKPELNIEYPGDTNTLQAFHTLDQRA
jgi:hypothetical protein